MPGCTIPARDGVRFPRRCVVCGEPATEDVSYLQDRAPIILPGFAYASARRVCWPYCAGHAERFRQRMRRLRRFQAAFAIPGTVLITLAAIGFLPPKHDIWRLLNWSPHASRKTLGILMVAGLVLLLVPAFTLFTKRLFYDAYLTGGARWIKISARSEEFIRELEELNPPPALDA